MLVPEHVTRSCRIHYERRRIAIPTAAPSATAPSPQHEQRERIASTGELRLYDGVCENILREAPLERLTMSSSPWYWWRAFPRSSLTTLKNASKRKASVYRPLQRLPRSPLRHRRILGKRMSEGRFLTYKRLRMRTV
jgi:hypothetical protein